MLNASVKRIMSIGNKSFDFTYPLQQYVYLGMNAFTTRNIADVTNIIAWSTMNWSLIHMDRKYEQVLAKKKGK